MFSIPLTCNYTENLATAYHITARLDAHLKMGGTWRTNLDAIDIPKPEWPASMKFAVRHNASTLIAAEVRQQMLNVYDQSTVVPPSSVLHLPLAEPEERYSLDDIEPDDEGDEMFHDGIDSRILGDF